MTMKITAVVGSETADEARRARTEEDGDGDRGTTIATSAVDMDAEAAVDRGIAVGAGAA